MIDDSIISDRVILIADEDKNLLITLLIVKKKTGIISFVQKNPMV